MRTKTARRRRAQFAEVQLVALSGINRLPYTGFGEQNGVDNAERGVNFLSRSKLGENRRLKMGEVKGLGISSPLWEGVGRSNGGAHTE